MSYRPILLCAILGSLLLSFFVGCGSRSAPDSAVSATSAAGPLHADADVTQSVKRLLADDLTVARFGLGVQTAKGDVKLTGTVDTPAQREHAVELARGAPGVHAIHNELVVRK